MLQETGVLSMGMQHCHAIGKHRQSHISAAKQLRQAGVASLPTNQASSLVVSSPCSTIAWCWISKPHAVHHEKCIFFITFILMHLLPFHLPLHRSNQAQCDCNGCVAHHSHSHGCTSVRHEMGGSKIDNMQPLYWHKEGRKDGRC